MVKRISLVLLMAVVLAACGMARFGRDFDLKVFEGKVERGTTTQSQVRGWLGEPVGIGITVDPNGERYEEWTYYYGETRLPNGADAFLKVLQIKFDRSGIVRAYNWSGDRPAGK
jgi:outer membrane protein assembly factor BamE (lipoprotein component of BamABCDE complex)